MTAVGLCDNGCFSESCMSSDRAAELGLGYRRTITYFDESNVYWQAVIDSARELLSVGCRTLVVFNTEASGTSVDDVDTHCRRLEAFLQHANGAVFAIEPGNELDMPEWGISNDLIVEIGRRTSEVCHAYGVTCLSPSLLSGPTEGRFEPIAAALVGYVDAMAVHPYYCSVGGQPYPKWYFGSVEQKANECAQLGSGLPTWFTELGCPTQMDGIGEAGQANWTLALQNFQHPAIHLAFQFTTFDAAVPDGEMQQGKDWGLIARDGRQKQAYGVWAARPPLDPEDDMAEFKLGIADEAARLSRMGYDVGDPLEDEVPIHAVPGGTQTHAFQMSSKGLFVYSAASNHVWFLPAEGS